MQKDKKQEIKEEKEPEETEEEQEEIKEETNLEPESETKKYYPRAVSIEQMFNTIDDKLDLILSKK